MKSLVRSVRSLSGILSVFCTVPCQLFVAANTCITPIVPATLQQQFFSFETAGMRKKDWTLMLLIIVVVVLILLVYVIFEKRIEAIPDKIN